MRSGIAAAVEHMLGLRQLEQIYQSLGRHDRGFCAAALRSLNVAHEINDECIDRIPKTGPLVVVSNHPFGALDGLLLADIVGRARRDVRLLANFVLQRIPEMAELCFFVDPFNRPESRQRNVASLRAAVNWLESGGALCVFPAGEVSHARWGRWRPSDPEWDARVARLISRSGAAVMPAHIDGSNSVAFHALGLLNPRLRTALLGRELLKRRNRAVTVRFGSVIDARRLAAVGEPEDLMSYLRVRSYMLRGGDAARCDDLPVAGTADTSVPVAPPLARDTLAREVEQLRPDQLLASQGTRQVFAARADDIPRILDEIGRLRERAFREVGEGTGRACDLDRFDARYVHLFVWDASDSAVVGAYRLGLTDEILATSGVDGLYTSTLFRFKRPLLDQIGPAIELGRSFVAPQYQRAYWPLQMLWRGIGRFVSAHPRYRRLFGPVSISAEYQSMSRRLLLAFLDRNRYLPSLGKLLEPRTPVRMPEPRDWEACDFSVVVRNLEEVERLVRELEADLRGVPVLLRQYLRLHSVLLGYNVDPDFGNVIDALLLTDLDRTDRRILGHYMGRDAAARFLDDPDHQRASSGR